MSWESITSLAAILTLLVMVIQRLDAQIKLAKQEAEEKQDMKARVGTLEKEFKGMSGTLADHMKHTSNALDALRSEMPIAMANAVTRAIASSLELQRNALEEFFANGTDSKNASRAATSATKPRTNRKRT